MGADAGRGLPRARPAAAASASERALELVRGADALARADRHRDRRRRRRQRAGADRVGHSRRLGRQRRSELVGARRRAPGRPGRRDRRLGAAAAALAVLEGRAARTPGAEAALRARPPPDAAPARGPRAGRGGRARDDRPLRRPRHRRRAHRPRERRATCTIELEALPLDAGVREVRGRARRARRGSSRRRRRRLRAVLLRGRRGRERVERALARRSASVQVSWIGEVRAGAAGRDAAQTSGETRCGSRDTSTAGSDGRRGAWRARGWLRSAAGCAPPGSSARGALGTVRVRRAYTSRRLAALNTRRARRQHQARVADFGDRRLDVVGRDDALAGDRVGEVRVGHVQQDVVAGFQEVDFAERRQVGRAVPGDRGRARRCRGSGFPGRCPGPLIRSPVSVPLTTT